LRQDSQAQEIYAAEDGTEIKVHLVVKNQPFVLIADSSVDLNKYKIIAKLVYNNEDDPTDKKEVICLKAPPLVFKAHLDSSGTRGTFELRIRVLTSQHEDSCFRVLIQVLNPITKYSFEISTEPIKVVSKLSGNNPKPYILPKKKPQSKKRSAENDSNIVQKLKELEEQQKQQREEIEKLTQAESKRENGIETDFETAFFRLVELYRASSRQERPEKVRKVLSTVGPYQLYIREMLSSFLTEGSLLAPQHQPVQISSDGLTESQLDNIYTQILTLDAPNLYV